MESVIHNIYHHPSKVVADLYKQHANNPKMSDKNGPYKAYEKAMRSITKLGRHKQEGMERVINPGHIDFVVVNDNVWLILFGV